MSVGLTTRTTIVRRAHLNDINTIIKIISPFVNKLLILPRSRDDIKKNIKLFFVAENTKKKRIIGVSSIYLYDDHLCEIRSLCVEKRFQRRGVGSALVLRCEDEARTMGMKKIFALTFNPNFFAKLNYTISNKEDLPQKIWQDCLKCKLFLNCKEVPLVKSL